jgi:hypothetical protein
MLSIVAIVAIKGYQKKKQEHAEAAEKFSNCLLIVEMPIADTAVEVAQEKPLKRVLKNGVKTIQVTCMSTTVGD